MSFQWLQSLTLYSSCICHFIYYFISIWNTAGRGRFWNRDFLLDLERVVLHYEVNSHPGPSKPVILKFKNFVNYEKILLSNAQAKRMSTAFRGIHSLVHLTAAFISELFSPPQCDYWLNYAILSKANFLCSPVGKKT